mmetsp:Transcript_14009/g.14029  ORF Transcript_14009/g.14029 Transcript_14009/m.14029 type:complete len:902 (+) Transcript_14009:226-2931(+)
MQPPTSIWKIIYDQFKNFIIQLLLFAGIVSLAIGLIEDSSEGWYEGCAIFISIFIVITVFTVQDYFKELQFRRLNSDTKRHYVNVVRNDELEEIWVNDLVAGDLMYLNPGDIAPADGILVRSYGVTVDESALTGESKTIEKGTDDPFIISGSSVVEGTGEMIVCCVGKNSTLGKHHKLILQQHSDEATPLEDKLAQIGFHIGIVGAIAAILIFVALSAFILSDIVEAGTWDSESTEKMFTAFIFAITILVVVIPEGLPLAVTLSLAFSMRKMKEENIFVKHLKACETMGGCQELLIDKTGTLTKNEMKVVKVLIGLKKANTKTPEVDPEVTKTLAIAVARNTTADVHSVDGNIEKAGNRTECALLMFLMDWGLNYHQYRNMRTQVMQVPFNSLVKMMSTFNVETTEDSALYIKGAPERIMRRCSHMLNPDGSVTEITSEDKEKVKAKLMLWSQKSLRTIAVAYKTGSVKELGLNDNPNKDQMDNAANGMVLVAIFGIEDPVRPEAKEAIETLRKTGVTVRIITGDNPDIASRIGKHCSILPSDYDYKPENDTIILGKDFDRRTGGLIVKEENEEISYAMGNEKEFKKIEEHLRILARCSPQDKLLLTIGMRGLGRIVAVTGDGTNDAAALQRADIGIAMMTATPMAKEASDIILLDDNIQSIVTAIKWGRNIYFNIRRYLQFQLTVNTVALLLCLIGAITVESSPLTAVQMLWVNLMMDSLAALALATQDPDDKVLDSTPYGKNEYILSPWIIANIIIQSVYQVTVVVVILFWGPDIFGIDAGWDSDWPEEESEHYTLCFNIFVMLQLFNQINCRKIRPEEYNVFAGIFNNWQFLTILSIEFVCQILFVQKGGDFMNTEPLSIEELVICILIGSTTLLVTLIFKIGVTNYYRPRNNEQKLV